MSTVICLLEPFDTSRSYNKDVLRNCFTRTFNAAKVENEILWQHPNSSLYIDALVEEVYILRLFYIYECELLFDDFISMELVDILDDKIVIRGYYE